MATLTGPGDRKAGCNCRYPNILSSSDLLPEVIPYGGGIFSTISILPQ